MVGSVANYLHRHGWQAGQPITTRARASADASFDEISSRSYKPSISVAEWQDRGFKSSAELAADMPAGVIKLVQEDRNSYWLVFKNFYVITRYNRSPRYAMAIFDLSQEIKTGKDQL